MALPEYRWVSVEEYLAIDNASDVRFEYVQGQLGMLAGESRNYALLISRQGTKPSSHSDENSFE